MKTPDHAILKRIFQPIVQGFRGSQKEPFFCSFFAETLILSLTAKEQNIPRSMAPPIWITNVKV